MDQPPGGAASSMDLGSLSQAPSMRGKWAAPERGPSGSTDLARVNVVRDDRRPPQRGFGVMAPGGLSSLQKSSKVVEVEALVLIRIMKHCKDYFPTPVNGLLLGLDSGSKLEVTDCFGLQNKRELWSQLVKERMDPKLVDEKLHLEYERFQVKMLEQLNLVNGDCLNVGWYQTMVFDDLKDVEVLESLCTYQETIEAAVVLGYDPQLASLGAKAFKAFRVSEKFLKKHREAELGDSSAYVNMRGRDAVLEVPLVVKNSLLIEAFIVDWIADDTVLQRAGAFDALTTGDRGNYMEKTLEFVSGCLDDLQSEQEKIMKNCKESARQLTRHKEMVERRRIENEQRSLRNDETLPELKEPYLNKLAAPSPLPTLMMSSRVEAATETIGELVGDNISRTFLSRFGA